LEKRLNFGGTIARSAGTHATLLKKFKYNQILIRLPSKEEILIGEKTITTLGRVSNVNHKFVRLTGAGQLRRLGVRPVVRGVARNPIDHPHGGGGGKCQVTAWSKIAKNKNTRRPKLFINSFIFLSRKKLKKKKESNKMFQLFDNKFIKCKTTSDLVPNYLKNKTLLFSYTTKSKTSQPALFESNFNTNVIKKKQKIF